MGMKVERNNVQHPRGAPNGVGRAGQPFNLQKGSSAGGIQAFRPMVEERLNKHPHLQSFDILGKIERIEAVLKEDGLKIDVFGIFEKILTFYNPNLEGIELEGKIVAIVDEALSNLSNKEDIWKKLLVFDVPGEETFFPLATMVQVAHLIFLHKESKAGNLPITSPLQSGQNIKILLETLSPKSEIYNFYRIAKEKKLIGTNQAEIEQFVGKNFVIAGEKIKGQWEALYATNRENEINDPLGHLGYLSELWQRRIGTEEELKLIVKALCQSVGVPFSDAASKNFNPTVINSSEELETFRKKEREIPLLSNVLSVWNFSKDSRNTLVCNDRSLFRNNLSAPKGMWRESDEGVSLEGDAYLEAPMTASLKSLGGQFSFSARIKPANSDKWRDLLVTCQNGKTVILLDGKETGTTDVSYVQLGEEKLQLFKGFKGVIENGFSLWYTVMSPEKIKEEQEKQKKESLQASSPIVFPPVQNMNISRVVDPAPKVSAMREIKETDKNHNAGLELWNKYLKYQEYAAKLERNQLKRAAKIGLWFGVPTPLVVQTAIKTWLMLNSVEYFGSLGFPIFELGAGVVIFSLAFSISYFVNKLIMRSTEKGLGLLGKKAEDEKMEKFLGIIKGWSQTDPERFKVAQAFITKAETSAQVDWVINCVLSAKEDEPLMRLSQASNDLMQGYAVRDGVLRREAPAELKEKLSNIQKEIKLLPSSMRDLSCAEEVKYAKQIADLQNRLNKLSEERDNNFKKDREDLPVLLGEIKIFWQVIKKISTEGKNETEKLGDCFGHLWKQINDILCEQNISKTGTIIWEESPSIPREDKPLTEESLEKRFFDAINRVQQKTDFFRASINLSKKELEEKQGSILESALTEADFVALPIKLQGFARNLISDILASNLIFTPPSTDSEEWEDVGGYKVCKLGAGGFADIYLTQDQKKILKILKLQYLYSEESRRLVREALAQQLVVHPNIAKVYGRDEKNGWLITEYVKGITLEEWMQTNEKGLTIIRALAILFQIADGLEAALVEGVFHRDISSRNIMLSVENPAELVKILDFGMCKFFEGGPAYEEAASNPRLNTASAQFSKMSGGTLDYIAPEQAITSLQEKGKLNFKVDLFALGVLLYRMLTGNLPFNYENKGVEPRVQHGIAWLDEQVNPDLTNIPEKIHSLLERLLKRNPLDRYDDYQELKEDILKIARFYVI